MKKFSGKFLDKFKEPRIRHGSMSVFITFFVIALIVLINLAANILTNKFSWDFDMTKNKVFSLTQESIDYLSGIDEDVKIIVLDSKENFSAINGYFKQADSVISEYSKYNNKIGIEYIELEKNPGVKSEYPEEELKSSSVIVKSGDKYKIVEATDMFNVEQSYTRNMITSSKAEQAMTSAIISVLSSNKAKINILDGFDEMDSSAFISLLDSNNYDVSTRSLLTDNIDEECQVAVIFAPKRDYDDKAIEKVSNYLYNNGNYGKNILYFINPVIRPHKNIGQLINDWGINAVEGHVYENDRSKIFDEFTLYSTLAEYSDSTYSEGIKNKSIPVAIPFARPIEITNESKAKSLLRFSDTAGVVPEGADNNWNPSKEYIKEHMPAIIMGSDKGEGESAKPSTLTVVGSLQAVDGVLLSRTSVNNSSYFLNLFAKLTERKDTVNIESKSIGAQSMGISNYHAIALGVIFGIFIPIIVLIIGLSVWIVRRKN